LVHSIVHRLCTWSAPCGETGSETRAAPVIFTVSAGQSLGEGVSETRHTVAGSCGETAPAGNTGDAEPNSPPSARARVSPQAFGAWSRPARHHRRPGFDPVSRARVPLAGRPVVTRVHGFLPGVARTQCRRVPHAHGSEALRGWAVPAERPVPASLDPGCPGRAGLVPLRRVTSPPPPRKRLP